MPYSDPAKRREAVRKSQQKAYAADPEKFRRKAREWAAAHPRPGSHNIKGTPSYERGLIALKEWKGQHPEAPVEYHRRAKQEFIDAHGGMCECLGCYQTAFEFLTLDHINGRGNSERKKFGRRTYARARQEGYHKDKYRLLCWNCNSSRGVYGYCPHERGYTNPLLSTDSNSNRGDLPVTNPG